MLTGLFLACHVQSASFTLFVTAHTFSVCPFWMNMAFLTHHVPHLIPGALSTTFETTSSVSEWNSATFKTSFTPSVLQLPRA